jgi:hypothetical protein
MHQHLQKALLQLVTLHQRQQHHKHLQVQLLVQFQVRVQVDLVQVTIHLLQHRVHRALVTILSLPVVPDLALAAE